MARKIRLLVVDDEVEFGRSLAKRLSLRDFAVDFVTGGEAALAAVRKRAFDVVLLDLKMPGMDGEEVLEILQRDHPVLEVVILTGHGTIDSAVRCTKGGSYGYLQKPADMDELLEVLREAYEKRLRKKFRLGEDKLRALVGLALVESPMGKLLRLRDFEEKRDAEDE